MTIAEGALSYPHGVLCLCKDCTDRIYQRALAQEPDSITLSENDEGTAYDEDGNVIVSMDDDDDGPIECVASLHASHCVCVPCRAGRRALWGDETIFDTMVDDEGVLHYIMRPNPDYSIPRDDGTDNWHFGLPLTWQQRMEFEFLVEGINDQREREALLKPYMMPIEPRADGAVKLPALVERVDGETVLYAHKLTTIVGEPGFGKSWLALLMGYDAARDHDARIVWLDYEDKAQTLADRAASIGALDLVQKNFVFLNTAVLDDPEAMSNAIAWASFQPQVLVVIDSAESAGCPSDGADVAPWFRANIDPWLATGAAVLLLDHVPKRKEDRGRGGIGSQHKLARADVALFLTGQPWTKEADGILQLVLHKDRAGEMPCVMGKTVTTVVGKWVPGRNGERLFTYSFQVPDPADEDEDGGARVSVSTVIMAIHEAGADGLRGTRAVRDAVPGERRAVDAALQRAIKDGMVEREQDGRAFVYRLTLQGRDMVAFQQSAQSEA